MESDRGVIFVAERHSMQNDLLVCHLDLNAGLHCMSFDGLDKFCAAESSYSYSHLLVLIDSLGLENSVLFDSIHTLTSRGSDSIVLALMNLSPEAAVEKTALELGVRGFFYEHDSIEVLVKGIRAMFSGEVWISRQKMFECLTREKKYSKSVEKKQTILTRREEEILRLLSRGGSNESIANTLCVSPHTVRTHIYNIFKKIDVPNRLQASLWAAKYL